MRAQLWDWRPYISNKWLDIVWSFKTSLCIYLGGGVHNKVHQKGVLHKNSHVTSPKEMVTYYKTPKVHKGFKNLFDASQSKSQDMHVL